MANCAMILFCFLFTRLPTVSTRLYTLLPSTTLFRPTLYVGRGAICGNPFIGETADAVAAYRAWLAGNCQVSVGPDQPIKRPAFIPALETPERIKAVLPQLRGRRLACWCALDQPCHADVLIELANRQSA